MAYAYRNGKSFIAGWVDEHERPVRKTLPSAVKTLSEARKHADELELRAWRIRNGLEKVAPARLTVSDGIKLRLESLPSDYRNARRLGELLRRIEGEFGEKFLDDVTPAHVLRFLNRLTELSLQTREHVRMTGQGLYSFLIQKAKAFAGENPFKAAGRVAVPQREPLAFTPQQLLQVLNVMTPQLLAPAAFSGLTAVRKGELRKLTKADVNLELRVAVLRNPKNRRDRRVHLPEALVPLLERQLRTPGPWLFPQADGRQYSERWPLHEVMARALVRAGLTQGFRAYCFRRSCGWREDAAVPLQPRVPAEARSCPKCARPVRWKAVPLPHRWKDLRSTWATLAVAATGDLSAAQAQLGHADVTTTRRRYQVVLPESVKRAGEAVAGLVALPLSAGGENSEEVVAAAGSSEKSEEAQS